MNIQQDSYRMLESIVGSNNVSNDPVITNNYSWNMNFGMGHDYFAEPGAVILPATAEEVQKIVKLCNRYKIIFKAFSTGWGAHAQPGAKGALLIDLRRMNRIIDIDEKNQYAIVEPYVNLQQLWVESQKVGLIPNVHGAGAQCSALASCTSGWGHGMTGVWTGYSGRNLLGAEWVIPNGDLLRIGALGQNCGWFCGEGPGPSVRGLMRGFIGALGSLGVFTKAAVKLSHWPGPRDFTRLGQAPNYSLDKPMENCIAIGVAFPDLDKISNAMYKIGDARIAYEIFRTGIAMSALMGTESNKQFEEVWKTGRFQSKPYILSILLFADSPRELDYKKRVLEEILDEEGSEFPLKQLDPVSQARRQFGFLVLDRNGVVFRPGTFCTCMGGQGALDIVWAQAPVGAKAKLPYIKKGLIMDDTGDNPASMLFEDGHYAYMEEMYCIDPVDKKAVEASTEFSKEVTVNAPLQYKWTTPCMAPFWGKDALLALGPQTSNFHVWQGRIKESFDPNSVADTQNYACL